MPNRKEKKAKNAASPVGHRRYDSASPEADNKSPRSLSRNGRNRSCESALDALGDKLSDSIAADATHLLGKFRSQYDSTAKGFSQKPNVLVAGCTGAGKSTLVNKVFGRVVAQTGAGVPVTQHFDRYELEEEAVVIYDSKGLEVGEHDNFIKTTCEFMKEHTDEIHVVWYIINSAGSRFQPFEGDVTKSLFNNIPIIFILNKADLSSKSDREALRASIMALNLNNCIGILDTVCTPSLSALKIPDLCPSCGSDDIDIKRKRKMMVCEECKYSENLVIETGLGILVSRTMDALPTLARERFVAAQRVSMHAKNVMARKIIVEYHDVDFPGARLERQLFKVVAKMLVRLSILWEFREHGHEYGTEIAKEHMGQYSLRDRMFLLVHKQDKKSEEKLAHTTALGIVWNRCVRDLYKSIFITAFVKQDGQVNRLVGSAFEHLSNDLDTLTAKLEADPDFTPLIDAEFPDEIDDDETCTVSLPSHNLDQTVVVTREVLSGQESGGPTMVPRSRDQLLATTGHYMTTSATGSKSLSPPPVGSSITASRRKHKSHHRDRDVVSEEEQSKSGSLRSSRSARAHNVASSVSSSHHRRHESTNDAVRRSSKSKSKTISSSSSRN